MSRCSGAHGLTRLLSIKHVLLRRQDIIIVAMGTSNRAALGVEQSLGSQRSVRLSTGLR